MTPAQLAAAHRQRSAAPSVTAEQVAFMASSVRERAGRVTHSG